MQLQQVKNDIAKIMYNPAENRLLPADFILIEDSNQKLIAQVTDIETDENSANNSAVLRLSLSIDKEDNLSFYNGYIPSKMSKIIYINPDEIAELIKGADDNLFLGALSNHQDCFVKPSVSLLNDKLYIRSDRADKTKIITENLIMQLKSKGKKVVLFDFDGSYSVMPNVPKLAVSKDFKLPLNIEAFNIILETDTRDCPLEDKALIQSIVLELREYLSTLRHNFLPFTVFKNVVDNEFTANPISGLLLLRNRLWLYAQEGLFAESRIQYDLIDSALSHCNAIIIDASKVEEKWYNFIIQTVLGLTRKQSYFWLPLNDVETDKKSIMNLYNSKNVIPVVSTSYDSKYKNLLKSLCKNHILCKPSDNINEEPCGMLLNKINSEEFIVFGNSTLYLPLIVDCNTFAEKTNDEIIENEIKKDVDKLFTISPAIIPQSSEVKPTEISAAKDKNDYTKEDELTESDLDFLDELDTYGEIQDTAVNKIIQKEECTAYDVFTPVSGIDETDTIKEEAERRQFNGETEPPKPAAENLSNNDILPDKKNDSDYNEAFQTDIKNDNESIIEGNIEKIKTENESEISESIITESVLIDETAPDETEKINNESKHTTVNEDNLTTVSETETVENNSDINENEGETSDILLVDDAINEDELTTVSETETVENTPDINENEGETPDILLSDDNKKNNVQVFEDEIQNDETAENLEENRGPTVIDNLITNIKSSSDIILKTDNIEPLKQENDCEQETEEIRQSPPEIKEHINTNTQPELTVYETDISAKISEKEIPFKIGDKVCHPKHGTGIIEGFTNYSNKILFCQIEFENTGRRILDLRVSGLKKISDKP